MTSIMDINLHADTMPLEGETTVPNMPKQKRRILYRECQIAGIAFHDLTDIWDELYEGAKLALVRHKNNKYDRNAVAVALADDYDGDPDNFDFDYILGYVPRSENEHLATMLDMGWEAAFECELSRINGHNPYKGSLYMSIYVVSKDEEEVNAKRLLRLLELNAGDYEHFTIQLETEGCAYFRWGGFPPHEHHLPDKGEKVVFRYTGENKSVLYLMYCMAVGDEDAAFFVEDKDSLFATDDCCYYVFTSINGPIVLDNDDLSFLSSEPTQQYQPETFLSEYASNRLYQLFEEHN